MIAEPIDQFLTLMECKIIFSFLISSISPASFENNSSCPQIEQTIYYFQNFNFHTTIFTVD